MSLKTKVKAGNITNLSDARYCAGMGVDWLGFPADAVDPKTFTEITSWVTGPQFVVELGTKPVEESLSLYPVRQFQIASSQLKEIEQLTSHSFIVTLLLTEWAHTKTALLKNKDRILTILLMQLSGEKNVDKNIVAEIAKDFQVLISLESSPYSLDEVLNFSIAGVNISGNQEMKPGLKDYSDLSVILEQLEDD